MKRPGLAAVSASDRIMGSRFRIPPETDQILCNKSPVKGIFSSFLKHPNLINLPRTNNVCNGMVVCNCELQVCKSASCKFENSNRKLEGGCKQLMSSFFFALSNETKTDNYQLLC